jgi:hypothetical protein
MTIHSQMRSAALVWILLLQLLTTWAAPAWAQEKMGSDVEREIRSCDRQIFLELVKLAEFNVRFQQTVNHSSRWRTFAYPMAQEAGYACFLGYSLTDISQRSRGWNNPRLISKRSIKGALSSATVGSLLGASSSMVELTASGLETLRCRREGFSVHQSVTFVQASVKQVNELLSRRNSLMQDQEIKGSRRELLELKEQLFKYERDRLVFEFNRWSSHSRGYAWYKNTFYLINAAVNMGRFSAVQVGFKAFDNPKFSGATGPILITSACLAAIGPAASSAVGNCIQRYQKRSLSKKLPVSNLLSDMEAKQKFEHLAQLLEQSETKQDGQLAAELTRLREEKIGLDSLIYHEERNIERFRRVAGQQAITAPLVSSLGVVSSTLGTIGYHGYRKRPIINNRLGIAGDSTLIVAEGIALLATPAAAIRTYRYERELKRKGEHPDQLRSKRLHDLQTLEKLVSDSWR